MRTMAGLMPANDTLSVEDAIRTLCAMHTSMKEQFMDLPKGLWKTAEKEIESVRLAINILGNIYERG